MISTNNISLKPSLFPLIWHLHPLFVYIFLVFFFCVANFPNLPKNASIPNILWCIKCIISCLFTLQPCHESFLWWTPTCATLKFDVSFCFPFTSVNIRNVCLNNYNNQLHQTITFVYIPKEAACSRQLPSPEVAMGNSRWHTPSSAHQFRRPKNNQVLRI